MKRERSAWMTGAACGLLLVLCAVSLCVGSFPLSLDQIGRILQGQLAGQLPARVFWTLRVPRTAVGLLAGLGLGLAGGVYQTVFRNPLASPDLTGVASGASLGAACAIVLGSGSTLALMAGAFGAGLASLVLVLALVKAARMEYTVTYVLAGVIVSSAADAALMALKVLADPERELAAIEFWTMGSLATVTAAKLGMLAPVVVLPLSLLLLFRRQAAILFLGDETARSLGLEPRRWRAVLLGLTTLMVSALVSVTGVIAFVGLIAPHIAFRLLGRRAGPYLILSALTGADLLLAADLLARSLSPGAELPLSIFTVLFAVPVLIALLCGRREGGDGDA